MFFPMAPLAQFFPAVLLCRELLFLYLPNNPFHNNYFMQFRKYFWRQSVLCPLGEIVNAFLAAYLWNLVFRKKGKDKKAMG